MSQPSPRLSPRWRYSVQACVLLAIGFLAGAFFREPAVIGQDSKNAPTRKAFLSGSERSVIVLEDILTVIKRMDERLDRMERVVAPQNAPDRTAR